MEFSKLKKGDVLSSTMYVTVLSKTKDAIEVKDNFGREFTVQGPKLIEEAMLSAQQFSKEEKVTKTTAAQILSSVGDAVFTVVFDKADGTERTLIGRLLESENLLGRSNVVDLEIAGPKDDGRRQVDHRTIKSIITKGTKYTVKK